jgi:hypothetical protein
LKTVAREMPASSASASTVAEWNSPSLIRRSAASRTLSTLFVLVRRRVYGRVAIAMDSIAVGLDD